jgi:DNA-binding HxlR family transcriptional regulator
MRSNRPVERARLGAVADRCSSTIVHAMRSLEQYRQKIDALQERCPVRAAIDVIRGRWKPSILFELNSGPRRFTDLQTALRGITPQALSLQLRQLEADGVVARAVFADEVPVRVEYSLTPGGRSLSGVMDQLEQWGLGYLAQRPGRKPRAA